MGELTKDWPVWAVFIALFCGSFLRGNMVYWLGRGVRVGGDRSRFAHHLERPSVQRAEGWVRRFGPIAVVLGHLTVGIQSAINAAAGALRMPQSRWLPAVILGALIWAAVYTSAGLAVFAAILGRVAWWWVLIAAGVIAAIVVVSRRLEGRRTKAPV